MPEDAVREDCQHTVLSEKEIRLRAAEEVERALRYRRPLSLFALELNVAALDSSQPVVCAAKCAVRAPDIVGYFGESSLLFIFPETAASAAIPAERVLAAVRHLNPDVRGGLVLCPHHGMTAESLIDAARTSASLADPSDFYQPDNSVDRLSFGETAPMVIAADEKTKRLFALIGNLAKSDLPILILGETGVGKEAVAAAVHHGSKYCDGPFVAVNCAAMPASLLESELFGYEKGAFSGAIAAKPGLMETAHGGTLFLDEVSEAPAEIQAKLLRVLETRRLRRIGAVQERSVSFRLVSAANRSQAQLREGEDFRADLFYRIGGARVEIAPLRERPADILPLARTFLAAETSGEGAPKSFDAEVEAMLAAYPWPGNVRELKHVAMYAAATASNETIGVQDLGGMLFASAAEHRPTASPPAAGEARVNSPSSGEFQKLSDEIRDLEKRRMTQALIAAHGARAKAAALIGMPLRTFVSKSKLYGLGKVGRARVSRGEGPFAESDDAL